MNLEQGGPVSCVFLLVYYTEEMEDSWFLKLFLFVLVIVSIRSLHHIPVHFFPGSYYSKFLSKNDCKFGEKKLSQNFYQTSVQITSVDILHWNFVTECLPEVTSIYTYLY